MRHVNLRLTHRYLYRNALAVAVFSLAVGLGSLFMPGLFFSASGYFGVLTNVIPSSVWGLLLVIAGCLIVGGLRRFSHRSTLVGLVLFASIMVAWSLGLFLLPVIDMGASLTNAFGYGLMAMVAISSVLESAINPTTAIKQDTKEGNE